MHSRPCERNAPDVTLVALRGLSCRQLSDYALGLSGAFAGGAPAAAAQQPAAAEHAPEPAQPRAKERTLAMLRVQAATQNFGYARVLDEATKGELGYNVGVSAVCLVAPDTAREMRVQEGQVVRLTRRHAPLEKINGKL